MSDESIPQNDNSRAPGEDESCLKPGEKFTYALGQVGVNLSPAIIMSWMIYYYTGRTGEDGLPILLVSTWAMAFLGLFGRVVDSAADPLVGYYSDKWNFRWGRRIPWIVLGTPFLALFSILIWFPPQPEIMGTVFLRLHEKLLVTPNFLWLTFMLSAFWFFYTVVVAPYLSLLPEITPYNKERLKLSELMAYVDVAAMLFGFVAVGAIIQYFSKGLDLGVFSFADGYQFAGVIVAVLFAAAFFISVSKVREKPFSQVKAVPFHFVQAMKESLKNPSFTPYVICVSFQRIALDILVAMIPFMVVNLMGLGEGWAGALQGIIILAAATMFWLVTRLSLKIGKKKVFSFGLMGFGIGILFIIPFHHFPFIGLGIQALLTPFGVDLSPGFVSFTHCVVVLLLSAFPISTAIVLQRVIYADVMDMDEELTGYRREAMYNGMEGLITKLAAGFAMFMVPLLIDYLGATADRPWGAVVGAGMSAFFMFCAWYTFRSYPIEK